MSTFFADYPTQAVEVNSQNSTAKEAGDPFTSDSSETQGSLQYRYSSFDTELLSTDQSSLSPTQTKRALEAHLMETDRRLQEASKLGTALVQQRRDISERLKEVEAQEGESEIGPELRQKLQDVEREYLEVGRDSARAFSAPKHRLLNLEETSNGASIAIDSRVRRTLQDTYY